MKYVLIDQIKNGDCFNEEFSTKEEAIRKGDVNFSNLSDYDKNRRDAFYVIESVNPDEDAENHLDGNVLKEWI